MQTVRDLRSGNITVNNLVERLAGDSRLGLSLEHLTEMMGRAQALTGLSATQVDKFCTAVRKEALNFPAASNYTPGAIL